MSTSNPSCYQLVEINNKPALIFDEYSLCHKNFTARNAFRALRNSARDEKTSPPRAQNFSNRAKRKYLKKGINVMSIMTPVMFVFFVNANHTITTLLLAL